MPCEARQGGGADFGEVGCSRTRLAWPMTARSDLTRLTRSEMSSVRSRMLRRASSSASLGIPERALHFLSPLVSALYAA